MDITKELQESKKRRAELIEGINRLEQEKQSLLQAVLREDGKVELLNKLAGEKKDDA